MIMKQVKIFFGLIISCAMLSSCIEPIEDRDELDGTVHKLDYTLKQENGYTILTLNNNDAIPAWEVCSYPDKRSLYIGSTRRVDTLIIPFKGDYWLRYSGYFNNGAVIDSQKFTVTENSEVYFKDPRWNYLTNGATGKTWELDATSPMGFYGTVYPDTTSGTDNWNWTPTFSAWMWDGVPWRDNFGTITFDLDGAFNFSRTQIDGDGNAVTTSGSFSIDINSPTMVVPGGRPLNILNINGSGIIIGGKAESLVASTSNNLKVYKIAQDSLIIGVLRTASPCYLGYLYRPVTK
jgi:hypothetical protein